MSPTSRVINQHHDLTNITDTILLSPIFNSFYRLNKNVHIFVFDQAVSWGFSFLMVSVHRISKPTSQSFLHQKIVSLLLCQTDTTIQLWKLFSNSFLRFNCFLVEFLYLHFEQGLSILYEYLMMPRWVFLNPKLWLYNSSESILFSRYDLDYRIKHHYTQ